MKSFLDWLDHRTGYRKLTHEALYENIPGGSRWRYVWGSTLTYALWIQFVTGIFLWFAYSPGSQGAWESVYYIQNQMYLGWFLRGVHHYTAQAMIILLALHLMQVLIDGAYKAPRELNFWTGLVLLLLVLGLSLTGYLLPWDQKGYWATKVVTSIMGQTPLVGRAVERLAVGGPDFGNLTITRFFTMHAGVIPSLIVLLIVGHIYLFRRHGITPAEPRRGVDAAFWPDQVLKDAVACLAVLAVVLFLVLYYHGAELGAPADPSNAYSAARPEWYFLFLFQFVKYFPLGTEMWGAIILPGFLLLVLFAMPFIGRWKLGHRFNLGLIGALLLGALFLTFLARRTDARDPHYQAAVAEAGRNADRARDLAGSPAGIPPFGAVNLLRNDALTQGPKLFAQYCATCHRFDGTDGLGNALDDPKNPPTASDLKGFASRAWLTGLLDPAQVDGPHYFGPGKFKTGKMVGFVKKTVAGFSPAEKAQLAQAIIALSAEAQLPAQKSADAAAAKLVLTGRDLIRNDLTCTDCHAFLKPDPDASAPDLTDYGSRQWIIDFITNSHQARFYGDRSAMPALGQQGVLDPHQIGLIADWLRGDWYDPDAQTEGK